MSSQPRFDREVRPAPPSSPPTSAHQVMRQQRMALLLLLGALSVRCNERPRTYDTLGNAPKTLFSADFDAGRLDPQVWLQTGEGVAIEAGRLTISGAKNHPLWLRMPLPDDIDIEFDAWANSEDGDIKVEIAGDGRSHATTASYTATGYVLVFGGWKNRTSIIARKDEHGRDRVSRNGPRVEQGRKYHFQIKRRGGTLHWKIDGQDMLSMQDPKPLRGPGQRHFAFNGWSARTQFDNLVIKGFDTRESRD